MEFMIQSIILIISFTTILYWLYRPPFADWLVLYLLAAIISHLLDSIIVKRYDMLSYPARILPDVFESCIIFNLFFFPLLNVLFYQVSAQSSFVYKCFTAVYFSASVCTLEFFIEKYTSLLDFKTWAISLSFFTIFTFLICMQYLFKLITSHSTKIMAGK